MQVKSTKLLGKPIVQPCTTYNSYQRRKLVPFHHAFPCIVFATASQGMWGIFAQAAQARGSIHHKTINIVQPGIFQIQRLCVAPNKTRRRRKNGDGPGDGGDEGGNGGGWWGGNGGWGDDWFSDDMNWNGWGRTFASYIWTIICWACFLQTIYFILFVSLPKSPFLACLTTSRFRLLVKRVDG
eukprot:TRINITY_DN3149_c0_g1_i2.p2 TRINITY_DN3149_c0_g1~~TRINITY_DN3149_c0_g1_i2.p2  ORF type:complete len:183 (+),score=9.72 TRINITY_DN3149_c0_g1_i2:114-662(+)